MFRLKRFLDFYIILLHSNTSPLLIRPKKKNVFVLKLLTEIMLYIYVDNVMVSGYNGILLLFTTTLDARIKTRVPKTSRRTCRKLLLPNCNNRRDRLREKTSRTLAVNEGGEYGFHGRFAIFFTVQNVCVCTVIAAISRFNFVFVRHTEKTKK